MTHSDWAFPETSLSAVALGIRDGTHGTYNRVAEGRPLLSAKNVRDGYVEVASDESLISERDFLAITRNGYPREGDVLLTIVGSIGRSAVYHGDGTAFQRSVCFVRPSNELNSQYAQYQFSGKHFQEQLALKTKTSAQPGVYLGDIGACRVFVPELSTQLSIVLFLDHETAEIDAFIADQEELITLLTERRAATISHAVTKGLDPTAPMKYSGIEWFGNIPETWTIAPIWSMISSIESGVSVNAADWPAEGGAAGVLKTSCVYSGLFDVTQNKTVNIDEIPRLACPVERNTVVVSRMNTPALVGAAGLAREDAPNIFLPDRLWKVRTTGDPRFFHYWTQSAIYRSQVSMASIGTSSSMQNLSQDRFSHLLIAVPDLDAQRSLADALDGQVAELDAAIADAREAIALSKERRAALISAAVTGKIDVREMS